MLWKEDKNSEDPTNSRSVFDEEFEIPKTNNIFLVIERRIQENQIGQLMHILSEVGAGRFEHFGSPSTGGEVSDEKLLTYALDVQDTDLYNSIPDPKYPDKGNHFIMGKGWIYRKKCRLFSLALPKCSPKKNKLVYFHLLTEKEIKVAIDFTIA